MLKIHKNSLVQLKPNSLLYCGPQGEIIEVEVDMAESGIKLMCVSDLWIRLDTTEC